MSTTITRTTITTATANWFTITSRAKKRLRITAFRVVRLKISDKTIETLITNLDFPPDELKELYNMRWGIETSFRDLKHTLKTIKFHSKSLEYARHEIFAGLIMYNFSALISTQTVLKSRKSKHIYGFSCESD